MILYRYSGLHIYDLVNETSSLLHDGTDQPGEREGSFQVTGLRSPSRTLQHQFETKLSQPRTSILLLSISAGATGPGRKASKPNTPTSEGV